MRITGSAVPAEVIGGPTFGYGLTFFAVQAVKRLGCSFVCGQFACVRFACVRFACVRFENAFLQTDCTSALE